LHVLSLPFCFYSLPPPPCSPLFPYTTLFRSVWLMSHGLPLTTVAERLRPESLFRRFVAYREGLGMEVLPLTGGPRPASEVLAERLRAGGVVCLVGDRDLTRSGVPGRFFGETATMPAAPAPLAAP